MQIRITVLFDVILYVMYKNDNVRAFQALCLRAGSL